MNPTTEKCKEAIGSALYPTLCSIFFSVSISHMSIDLRCTVSQAHLSFTNGSRAKRIYPETGRLNYCRQGYTLLSECAEAHKANQKRLRDNAVLGG